MTLMPGLIDVHVHVMAATANFAELETWSPTYVVARAGELMRAMLLRGFTTVRDTGGADHGLADAIDEGYLTGPRLIFGRKAIYNLNRSRYTLTCALRSVVRPARRHYECRELRPGTQAELRIDRREIFFDGFFRDR